MKNYCVVCDEKATSEVACMRCLKRYEEMAMAKERANVVAVLREELERCSSSKHFEQKWAPSTVFVVKELIDLIERMKFVR